MGACLEPVVENRGGREDGRRGHGWLTGICTEQGHLARQYFVTVSLWAQNSHCVDTEYLWVKGENGFDP